MVAPNANRYVLTRPWATDVATLAELLHETVEHHDHYEKTHAEHTGGIGKSYLSARQSGNSPEESAAAAERNMEEVLHVLAR